MASRLAAGISERWVARTLTPGLVFVTTATDLLTTLVGLAVVDGLAEQNPAGAWVYQEFGALGLTGATLAAVLCVIALVEWTATRIESLDRVAIARSHLAVGAYLPAILVSTVLTVQNALLVVQQLS